MTDVERKRKFIINIIYYVLLGFIGLLLVKYAFGVCFPIFFAFVVAFFLQRPKNFLVRKTFLKNGTASTLCVIAMTLLVLALVALIGVRVAEEVKSFIDYVMMQFQNIDVLINNVEVRLSSIVAGLPDFLSKSLSESLANLFTQVREFVAGTNDELSSQITSSLSGSFSLSWITAPLSGVISTAKHIPSVVIAIVISIVAACFMTAEFDKVRDFIILQFPEEKRDDFDNKRSHVYENNEETSGDAEEFRETVYGEPLLLSHAAPFYRFNYHIPLLPHVRYHPGF